MKGQSFRGTSRVAMMWILVITIVGAGFGLAFGQSNELVVTLPGGTLEKVLRKSWVEPFEKKYNAKAIVATGLTMEILAKLRAQKGNPQLDVVGFDPPGAIPAANEGLLEKLDPERIPNLKDQYPFEVQKHGFFATQWLSNHVLAYNTNFIKEPPKSWADLWKPEFKGKVILPDISTVQGVYFVMIISKMQTGGDLYNTEAVFAKLKTLRPNVLTFWTSHDQVAQLLNSGEAWLAPWAADRALTQMAAKAPIALTVPKEGTIYFTSQIAIAKGTKNKALAEKYLDVAISAPAQLMDAQEAFLGPANSKVKLEGFLAENLAYGETLKKMVPPDWNKMDQVRDGWTERWNWEIR
jgi:putative spermidine/putrescine transport system substrate-binding protein